MCIKFLQSVFTLQKLLKLLPNSEMYALTVTRKSSTYSILTFLFTSSVLHAAHLQGPAPACHPPAGDPEPGSVQPHHRVDYQQPAAVPAPQWPLPHLRIPLVALRHLIQRPQRLREPEERWGRADAAQADGRARSGGREIPVWSVQQVLLHVLWTAQTQTATLRRPNEEILQLQILREGVRQPRSSQNAHQDSHVALCLQNMREGILQTVAAPRTHQDAHRWVAEAARQGPPVWSV